MPSNFDLTKKNSWYTCLEKNGKCPIKAVPKNNIGAPFGSNTNIQGNILTPGMRYSTEMKNNKRGKRIQINSGPAINKKIKFELIETGDESSLFIGIKDYNEVIISDPSPNINDTIKLQDGYYLCDFAPFNDPVQLIVIEIIQSGAQLKYDLDPIDTYIFNISNNRYESQDDQGLYWIFYENVGAIINPPPDGSYNFSYSLVELQPELEDPITIQVFLPNPLLRYHYS